MRKCSREVRTEMALWNAEIRAPVLVVGLQTAVRNSSRKAKQ